MAYKAYEFQYILILFPYIWIQTAIVFWMMHNPAVMLYIFDWSWEAASLLFMSTVYRLLQI